MKIAWFTPFDVKSAIGYYSLLAVEELAKSYEISVFAPKGEALFTTKIPIITIDWDFPIEQLKEYDYVIYNIGDCFEYHGIIYEIALRFPGIVIMHDLAIMNLIYGYYMQHLRSADRYVRDLGQYYGMEAAENILKASHIADEWAALDYQRFNGFDLLNNRTQGVIVHSQNHLNALRKNYYGPICKVPFPFLKENGGASKINCNKGRLQALTVGNVNPNKCIAQVIEAIGSDSDLAKELHYFIAGRTDGSVYEQRVKSLIKRGKLCESVDMTGYIEKGELERLYRDADIIVNLRNPIIEGASWSLLEAMAEGKAVIVYNHGCYAEIPDDCAIKIEFDSENEIDNIAQALRRVVANPEMIKKIGKNAAEYVEKSFSPKIYAETLSAFLDNNFFLKPIYTLVDQISEELNAMGATQELGICKRVSSEIAGLFSK